MANPRVLLAVALLLQASLPQAQVCCDPGQELDEESLCQDCPAGKAAWKDKDSGKQKCQLCDVCKKAYSEAKSVTCSMCGASPGEFWEQNKDEAGNALVTGSCRKCPTGSVAQAMDPEDVIQQMCKGGTCTLFGGEHAPTGCGNEFTDEPCQSCVASDGQYSNEFGKSECKICPNGKAVNETFASSAMWDSDSNPNSCRIIQNTFNGWKHIAGDTELCPACTAFTARCADANYCTDCPSGKAGKEGRCDPCYAGQFQDSTAELTCKDCPAGRYQNEDGATDCIDCPAGKAKGAGVAAPLGGMMGSQCENCTVGQYQDSTAQLTCKDCAAGRYQNENGATDCIDCPAGKAKGAAVGMIGGACDTCEAGYYQEESGKSTCKECPAGFYQNDEESSNCKECPAGKSNSWTAGSDVSMCFDCEAGRFQGSPGSSDCQACDAGRSQPNKGETECVNCAEGRYAQTTGFQKW